MTSDGACDRSRRGERADGPRQEAHGRIDERKVGHRIEPARQRRERREVRQLENRDDHERGDKRDAQDRACPPGPIAASPSRITGSSSGKTASAAHVMAAGWFGWTRTR